LEYIAAAGALALIPVAGVAVGVAGGALALDAIVRSVDISKTGTASGSIYAKLVDYGVKSLGHLKQVGKRVLYDLFTPAQIKKKHQEDIKISYAEREERADYVGRVSFVEFVGGIGLIASGFAFGPVVVGIGAALVVDGLFRYQSYSAMIPVEIIYGIAKETHYVGNKIIDVIKTAPKMITETKDKIYKDIEDAAILTKKEEEKKIEELKGMGHLSLPEQTGGCLSLAKQIEQLPLVEDTVELEEYY
jgi:uncharacterized membrane protein